MNNQVGPMIWKPASAESARTPPQVRDVAELEIDVVFTTAEGALVALKRASELSRDLGAGVRLVVPAGSSLRVLDRTSADLSGLSEREDAQSGIRKRPGRKSQN